MGVNIVAHRNVLSTCNFKEDNKSDVYYCIRNGTDFCMVAWPFYRYPRRAVRNQVHGLYNLVLNFLTFVGEWNYTT